MKRLGKFTGKIYADCCFCRACPIEKSGEYR